MIANGHLQLFSYFFVVSDPIRAVADASVAATDSGGDGLTDATENTLGTALRDADSDGDGISDTVETTHPDGTGPGEVVDNDGTHNYRDPKDDHGPNTDPPAAVRPVIDETNGEIIERSRGEGTK